MEIATAAVTTLAGSGMPGSVDGTGPAASFWGPYGVALDGKGNLFFADRDNSNIRKVEIATGAVTTVAGSAGMRGSSDGTGTSARFDHPTGVAGDGSGNLFIADTDNHTTRKVILATGSVTTLAGTAGSYGSADGTCTAARFYDPHGVAVDGSGNLLVADTDNHTIRKVMLATSDATTVVGVPGRVGIVPGPLPAGLHSPSFLAVSSTGELFISDQVEPAVLVVR